MFLIETEFPRIWAPLAGLTVIPAVISVDRNAKQHHYGWKFDWSQAVREIGHSLGGELSIVVCLSVVCRNILVSLNIVEELII